MELKDGLVGLGDVVLKSFLPGLIGNAISQGLHALTDDERNDPNKINEVVQTQMNAAQNLDLMKAVMADMANARGMQVEALKQSPRASFLHAITPALLSYAITCIMAWMIYLLFAKLVPPENRDLFNYLLGCVTGISGVVYSFWFGAMNDKNKK